MSLMAFAVRLVLLSNPGALYLITRPKRGCHIEKSIQGHDFVGL